MRTLFARVLAWFLILIVVLTGGFLILELVGDSPYLAGRTGLLARRLILDAARRVYEEEGPEGVARYLAHLESEFSVLAVVTDSRGRDLANGSDRMLLIREAEAALLPIFSTSSGTFMSATDAYGNYVFMRTPEGPSGFFSARRVWVIIVVIGLCYVLARHLTAPLKRLRNAVERFGAGDLSTRVKSARRDEVGQLSRTFDSMADQIQKLLANERTLLYDISHELRSPLTRLGLAVELGRSGGDKDEAYDRIEREAGRLNALVGELLDWSRSGSMALTLQKTEVRLDEMLEDLINSSRLQAEEKNCRLVLECPRSIVIRANGEALRRAVENVLNNAIRFAPAGTDVVIRLDQAGDAARIRIRDLGPGVPAESLPRIFEAFYRVDSDRNRETGGCGPWACDRGEIRRGPRRGYRGA